MQMGYSKPKCGGTGPGRAKGRSLRSSAEDRTCHLRRQCARFASLQGCAEPRCWEIGGFRREVGFLHGCGI